MGFINTVKEAISRGEDSHEEIGEEFQDEIAGQQVDPVEDDFDTEVQESEEEGIMEWETCYQFCEEMLEDDGFSSMMDFTRKAMFYEIERCPLFRDRLENGLATISKVEEAKKSMEALRGKESRDSDFDAMAQKLESANRLNEQLDKLEGKEEQMVEDAMELGYEAVDALRSRRASASGDVDASSSVSGEPME